MADRWTVDMSVTKHRMATRPQLTYNAGMHDQPGSNADRSSATKGILIALCLSALLWTVLLRIIF